MIQLIYKLLAWCCISQVEDNRVLWSWFSRMKCTTFGWTKSHFLPEFMSHSHGCILYTNQLVCPSYGCFIPWNFPQVSEACNWLVLCHWTNPWVSVLDDLSVCTMWFWRLSSSNEWDYIASWTYMMRLIDEGRPGSGLEGLLGQKKCTCSVNYHTLFCPLVMLHIDLLHYLIYKSLMHQS